jgi:hypothetical protein
MKRFRRSGCVLDRLPRGSTAKSEKGMLIKQAKRWRNQIESLPRFREGLRRSGQSGQSQIAADSGTQSRTRYTKLGDAIEQFWHLGPAKRSLPTQKEFDRFRRLEPSQNQSGEIAEPTCGGNGGRKRGDLRIKIAGGRRRIRWIYGRGIRVGGGESLCASSWAILDWGAFSSFWARTGLAGEGALLLGSLSRWRLYIGSFPGGSDTCTARWPYIPHGGDVITYRARLLGDGRPRSVRCQATSFRDEPR